MTHTSTEQPEALQYATALRSNSVFFTPKYMGFIADELERLHARVQELEAERAAIIAEKDEYKVALRAARTELEASQAQRVPLSAKQRQAIFDDLYPHGAPPETRAVFAAIVDAIDRHGITQEKQG